MFNSDPKNEGHLPKPTAARPSGASRSASPFEPAVNAESGASVIATDLTILGDHITVISKNRLQVDGNIRGNVHGKHVVITEKGSVVGMVSAETIEVRGGVRGSIRAVSVKLQASARVEGDITHQTLAIAEGAEFAGSVKLSKETSELMPILDPEEIEQRRLSAA
jgi:cytoskeletal protein CcmA (bactofilin family)